MHGYLMIPEMHLTELALLFFFFYSFVFLSFCGKGLERSLFLGCCCFFWHFDMLVHITKHDSD